ncbi:MAG: hypothetical protein IK078_07935, partial [Lachnospiraceae bacterium]|nr:hypothetical protein [Lachnospiraceae bacterium]
MTEQKNGKSKAEGKQKDNLLGLPVLLCVLKGITSEDAALSAAELTREMREVTGEEYSVKTVGRHLEKLQEAKEKKDYASIMRYAFGGEVMATQAKSVRGRGIMAGNPQNRYYFRPCIDESSMKLISGSIISNMFLSCEEKDYLLAGMRMLNMQGEIYDPEAEEMDFSERIHKSEDENEVAFPGDASVFLDHVGWLDFAI